MAAPRFIPLAFLALTTALSAQQPSPGIGLGISMDVTNSNGGRPVRIRVPLRISRHVLLEPGFGFLLSSLRNQSVTNGNISQSSTSSVHLWDWSLAAYYLVPAGDRLRAYVGPRIALQHFSDDETLTTTGLPPIPFSIKRGDKLLSGVVGAEFFVLPRFTLGGEISLTYIDVGDVDVQPSPGPIGVFLGTVDHGQVFGTSGEITFRWYFGGRK